MTMLSYGFQPWEMAAWEARNNIEKYSDDDGNDIDIDDFSDDDGFGGCMGYSHDDVMDLAAQGIKPWDDDASAALDALHGFY
jgi:RimJ/RimL family protein N-acetyltransferase